MRNSRPVLATYQVSGEPKIHKTSSQTRKCVHVCKCIRAVCTLVCMTGGASDCVWVCLCVSGVRVCTHVHAGLCDHDCTPPCVDMHVPISVCMCVFRNTPLQSGALVNSEGSVPAPGDSPQRGIKAISCHESSLQPLKLPHSGSSIRFLATGPL